MAILNIFKNQIEIVFAAILFSVLFLCKKDFYELIVLLLEFIVVVEVVQMISVFIKKERIKLRYMIDATIIFIIRDVLIAISDKNINDKKIFLLLFVIFIFFIFRIFAIKTSYRLQN